MKKYFLLLLTGFPCLIFSQSKEAVESAIDKINIELVRGFVQEHGKSFSKEVKDWNSLYDYIKRMYPDERHKVHRTFLDINYAKRRYRNGEDPSEFINGLLEKYVKYDFDRKSINKIISSIKVENNESIAAVDNSEGQKTNEEEIIEEINEIEDASVKSENILPSENQDSEENTSSTSNNDPVDKENKEENNYGWLYLPIGLLIGYLLRVFIEKLMLRKEDENNHPRTQGVVPSTNIVDNPIRRTNTKSISTKPVLETSLVVDEDESKVVPKSITKSNWVIAHTSETGKLHLISSPPIPCQDNHAVKNLKDGWGIAVLCDGAGSAKLSHEGSKFITDEALQLFETIVRENEWIENNNLPKQGEWEMVARRALKKLRYDLELFAKDKKVASKDLACTVILVIYSPIGLLVTHIGDGRAGYRNQKNTWLPIISPHKGEEANQTIFITSNPWLDDNFTMSELKVPESNVINDVPSAFTLMSDGCESHSFEIGYFDNEKQKFIEQNSPYPKFFEPLLQTLLNMKKEGLTSDEINQKWSNFVKAGTEKLKNEPDDKTLILGVLTD